MTDFTEPREGIEPPITDYKSVAQHGTTGNQRVNRGKQAETVAYGWNYRHINRHTAYELLRRQDKMLRGSNG